MNILLVILDWFGVVNSELTNLFNQSFDTSAEQQARIKSINDQSDAGLVDVQAVYHTYAEVITQQAGQSCSSHQAKAWLDAHSGIDWQLVELVQTIRSQNVKVVIGSNAASDHRPNLIRNGMLDYFDDVYVSSDMGNGIKKPDASFFAHILQQQGVTADQTLFIDDADIHVAGARAAGIHAEQYGSWGDLTKARHILAQYNLI